MPSVVNNPSKVNTLVDKLSGYEGGHGGETAGDARDFLKAFANADRGDPTQPVPLTAARKIDAQYVRPISAANISIDGPLTLGVNEKARYYITTFDSYRQYTVTATRGKAVLTNQWIDYQAPDTPGVGGFSIGSRDFEVQITGAAIEKPSVVYPAHGQEIVCMYLDDVYDPVIFQSTEFSILGSAETQVAADWEIYRVAAPVGVDNQPEDVSVLTSGPVIDDEGGDLNWSLIWTKYRGTASADFQMSGSRLHDIAPDGWLAIRVRHNSETHSSLWSDFRYFTVDFRVTTPPPVTDAPVIQSVSIDNISTGGNYPNLLKRLSIALVATPVETWTGRYQTEYQISQADSVVPYAQVAATYLSTPGVPENLYSINTVLGDLKHTQEYNIRARYILQDTMQPTAWSDPYYVNGGSMSVSHTFETIDLVVFTEERELEAFMRDDDPTLQEPQYNPATRIGSIGLYTLHGFTRSYSTTLAHPVTQWDFSLTPDFSTVFASRTTEIGISRYVAMFNDILFPETGFEDYLNTTVYVRARYSYQTYQWAPWSAVTLLSQFKFGDF